ncbi:unnamed protein product [Polarella glacialis]|uniref:Uncharacterized protein n=1 Tax=Polarella glacialis TaxID=89957 RepID=A0A813LS05_POLGL|nr:unnamed protein product [Polarella glacialis]
MSSTAASQRTAKTSDPAPCVCRCQFGCSFRGLSPGMRTMRMSLMGYRRASCAYAGHVSEKQALFSLSVTPYGQSVSCLRALTGFRRFLCQPTHRSIQAPGDAFRAASCSGSHDCLRKISLHAALGSAGPSHKLMVSKPISTCVKECGIGLHDMALMGFSSCSARQPGQHCAGAKRPSKAVPQLPEGPVPAKMAVRHYRYQRLSPAAAVAPASPSSARALCFSPVSRTRVTNNLALVANCWPVSPKQARLELLHFPVVASLVLCFSASQVRICGPGFQVRPVLSNWRALSVREQGVRPPAWILAKLPLGSRPLLLSNAGQAQIDMPSSKTAGPHSEVCTALVNKALAEDQDSALLFSESAQLPSHNILRSSSPCLCQLVRICKLCVIRQPRLVRCSATRTTSNLPGAALRVPPLGVSLPRFSGPELLQGRAEQRTCSPFRPPRPAFSSSRPQRGAVAGLASCVFRPWLGDLAPMEDLQPFGFQMAMADRHRLRTTKPAALALAVSEKGVGGIRGSSTMPRARAFTCDHRLCLAPTAASERFVPTVGPFCNLSLPLLCAKLTWQLESGASARAIIRSPSQNERQQQDTMPPQLERVRGTNANLILALTSVDLEEHIMPGALVATKKALFAEKRRAFREMPEKRLLLPQRLELEEGTRVKQMAQTGLLCTVPGDAAFRRDAAVRGRQCSQGVCEMMACSAQSSTDIAASPFPGRAYFSAPKATPRPTSKPCCHLRKAKSCSSMSPTLGCRLLSLMIPGTSASASIHLIGSDFWNRAQEHQSQDDEISLARLVSQLVRVWTSHRAQSEHHVSGDLAINVKAVCFSNCQHTSLQLPGKQSRSLKLSAGKVDPLVFRVQSVQTQVHQKRRIFCTGTGTEQKQGCGREQHYQQIAPVVVCVSRFLNGMGLLKKLACLSITQLRLSATTLQVELSAAASAGGLLAASADMYALNYRARVRQGPCSSSLTACEHRLLTADLKSAGHAVSLRKPGCPSFSASQTKMQSQVLLGDFRKASAARDFHWGISQGLPGRLLTVSVSSRKTARACISCEAPVLQRFLDSFVVPCQKAVGISSSEHRSEMLKPLLRHCLKNIQSASRGGSQVAPAVCTSETPSQRIVFALHGHGLTSQCSLHSSKARARFYFQGERSVAADYQNKFMLASYGRVRYFVVQHAMHAPFAVLGRCALASVSHKASRSVTQAHLMACPSRCVCAGDKLCADEAVSMRSRLSSIVGVTRKTTVSMPTSDWSNFNSGLHDVALMQSPELCHQQPVRRCHCPCRPKAYAEGNQSIPDQRTSRMAGNLRSGTGSAVKSACATQLTLVACASIARLARSPARLSPALRSSAPLRGVALTAPFAVGSLPKSFWLFPQAVGSCQALAPLPVDAEHCVVPGCCLSPAVEAKASARLLSSSSSPPARLLRGSQLTLGLPRQGCLSAALSRGGGSHRSCNTFNSGCGAQLRRCFRAFYAPAGDAPAALQRGKAFIKRRMAFFAEPLREILGTAGSLKKGRPKLGSIPSEFPKLGELHDMALMGFCSSPQQSQCCAAPKRSKRLSTSGSPAAPVQIAKLIVRLCRCQHALPAAAITPGSWESACRAQKGPDFRMSIKQGIRVPSLRAVLASQPELAVDPMKGPTKQATAFGQWHSLFFQPASGSVDGSKLQLGLKVHPFVGDRQPPEPFQPPRARQVAWLHGCCTMVGLLGSLAGHAIGGIQGASCSITGVRGVVRLSPSAFSAVHCPKSAALHLLPLPLRARLAPVFTGTGPTQSEASSRTACAHTILKLTADDDGGHCHSVLPRTKRDTSKTASMICALAVSEVAEFLENFLSCRPLRLSPVRQAKLVRDPLVSRLACPVQFAGMAQTSSLAGDSQMSCRTQPANSNLRSSMPKQSAGNTSPVHVSLSVTSGTCRSYRCGASGTALASQPRATERHIFSCSCIGSHCLRARPQRCQPLSLTFPGASAKYLTQSCVDCSVVAREHQKQDEEGAIARMLTRLATLWISRRAECTEDPLLEDVRDAKRFCEFAGHGGGNCMVPVESLIGSGETDCWQVKPVPECKTHVIRAVARLHSQPWGGSSFVHPRARSVPPRSTVISHSCSSPLQASRPVNNAIRLEPCFPFTSCSCIGSRVLRSRLPLSLTFPGASAKHLAQSCVDCSVVSKENPKQDEKGAIARMLTRLVTLWITRRAQLSKNHLRDVACDGRRCCEIGDCIAPVASLVSTGVTACWHEKPVPGGKRKVLRVVALFRNQLPCDCLPCAAGPKVPLRPLPYQQLACDSLANVPACCDAVSVALMAKRPNLHNCPFVLVLGCSSTSLPLQTRPVLSKWQSMFELDVLPIWPLVRLALPGQCTPALNIGQGTSILKTACPHSEVCTALVSKALAEDQDTDRLFRDSALLDVACAARRCCEVCDSLAPMASLVNTGVAACWHEMPVPEFKTQVTRDVSRFRNLLPCDSLPRAVCPTISVRPLHNQQLASDSLANVPNRYNCPFVLALGCSSASLLPRVHSCMPKLQTRPGLSCWRSMFEHDVRPSWPLAWLALPGQSTRLVKDSGQSTSILKTAGLHGEVFAALVSKALAEDQDTALLFRESAQLPRDSAVRSALLSSQHMVRISKLGVVRQPRGVRCSALSGSRAPVAAANASQDSATASETVSTRLGLSQLCSTSAMPLQLCRSMSLKQTVPVSEEQFVAGQPDLATIGYIVLGDHCPASRERSLLPDHRMRPTEDVRANRTFACSLCFRAHQASICHVMPVAALFAFCQRSQSPVSRGASRASRGAGCCTPVSKDCRLLQVGVQKNSLRTFLGSIDPSHKMMISKPISTCVKECGIELHDMALMGYSSSSARRPGQHCAGATCPSQAVPQLPEGPVPAKMPVRRRSPAIAQGLQCTVGMRCLQCCHAAASVVTVRVRHAARGVEVLAVGSVAKGALGEAGIFSPRRPGVLDWWLRDSERLPARRPNLLTTASHNASAGQVVSLRDLAGGAQPRSVQRASAGRQHLAVAIVSQDFAGQGIGRGISRTACAIVDLHQRLSPAASWMLPPAVKPLSQRWPLPPPAKLAPLLQFRAQQPSETMATTILPAKRSLERSGEVQNLSLRLLALDVLGLLTGCDDLAERLLPGRALPRANGRSAGDAQRMGHGHPRAVLRQLVPSTCMEQASPRALHGAACAGTFHRVPASTSMCTNKNETRHVRQLGRRRHSCSSLLHASCLVNNAIRLGPCFPFTMGREQSCCCRCSCSGSCVLRSRSLLSLTFPGASAKHLTQSCVEVHQKQDEEGAIARTLTRLVALWISRRAQLSKDPLLDVACAARRCCEVCDSLAPMASLVNTGVAACWHEMPVPEFKTQVTRVVSRFRNLLPCDSLPRAVCPTISVRPLHNQQLASDSLANVPNRYNCPFVLALGCSSASLLPRVHSCMPKLQTRPGLSNWRSMFEHDVRPSWPLAWLALPGQSTRLVKDSGQGTSILKTACPHSEVCTALVSKALAEDQDTALLFRESAQLPRDSAVRSALLSMQQMVRIGKLDVIQQPRVMRCSASFGSPPLVPAANTTRSSAAASSFAVHLPCMSLKQTVPVSEQQLVAGQPELAAIGYIVLGDHCLATRERSCSMKSLLPDHRMRPTEDVKVNRTFSCSLCFRAHQASICHVMPVAALFAFCQRSHCPVSRGASRASRGAGCCTPVSKDCRLLQVGVQKTACAHSWAQLALHTR